MLIEENMVHVHVNKDDVVGKWTKGTIVIDVGPEINSKVDLRPQPKGCEYRAPAHLSALFNCFAIREME